MKTRAVFVPPPDRSPAALESAVPELLEGIRRRFYAKAPPAHFHRDRRMLLYALTWPAGWLDSRGLTCSPARYQALIAERLDVICAHGDPARYGAYFPAYLLKCLQDWFQHRSDELYAELKHIRNALDRILGSVGAASEIQLHARHVELLAATHRLLHAHRPHRVVPNAAQLSLF
jgi:hypothetical protein